MRRLQAIKPMISILTALLVLTLNNLCFGQASGNPFHSSPSNPTTGENTATYAPVGPSGYKVLIPEIKMNRIVGEAKPKPKIPANIPPEPVSPVEEPKPELAVKPAPETETSSGTQETTEKPIDDRAVETPTQPVEEAPSEQVTRLPFDHSDRKSASPTGKEDLEQDLKEKIEQDGHMFGPPLAPVNITEALPEPTKESLVRPQSPAIPKVKGLGMLKGEQQPVEVESLQDQGTLAPEDWVALQERKDGDQLPFEEPKQEPVIETTQLEKQEKQETKEIQPKEASDAGVQNLTQPEEEPPPPTPQKEEQPINESQKVDTGASETKIEPAPAPKEQIPSPLDDQALNDNNLRLYLSETAPVLEELSLLMARAPSLTMADYDPSEVSTPTMPQDLGLKLESMKRDLRILDSKVFSIIPPSKYDQFHELIRQSISQTYLACEAISNYFQEAKPEDLQKVKEHLTKAKELIQQTRKRNGAS